MKQILIAGAAVFALTAAQPTTAQAQVNWNGFYVGGNAGYGWGNSDTNSPLANGVCGICYIPSVVADINAQRFQSVSSSGFLGGVQIGFNIQSPPSPFVFGTEVDFSSFNLSGTSAASAFFTGFPGPGTPPTYTNSISTNWLFTARGRLGITSGGWLIYGTLGVAVTDLTYTHRYAEGVFAGSSSGLQASTVSATRLGVVYGGGFEFAWQGTPWSVKAEYLHIDFGSVTSTAPVTFGGVAGGSVFTHSADLTVDIFRVGVNYAFATH